MLKFIEHYPGNDKETFANKVVDVAKALGVSADTLMGIMYFETEHTLDPAIQNSLGYTGLIQFGKEAASDLGTTTEELKSMSGTDQLNYVQKYFERYKSKFRRPVDVYLAVLFPHAIGQPDNTVLESDSISKETLAKQNPIFDKDKKGYITVGDVRSTLLPYII